MVTTPKTIPAPVKKSKQLFLTDHLKRIPFVGMKKKGDVLYSFQLTDELKDCPNPEMQIAKAVIAYAPQFGINLITDNYYLPGVFKFEYYTELELNLGHTQRPKHCKLTKYINYFFEVIIKGDQVDLLIIQTGLEPQIMSNPKDWLLRIRGLEKYVPQS